MLFASQLTLYRISELIDVLPSSATDLRELDPHRDSQKHATPVKIVNPDLQSSDLRKLRDAHRIRLEQDMSSWTALPRDTDPPEVQRNHTIEERQRMTLDVYKAVSEERDNLLHLGNLTLMAANHALKVMERRISSYLIYILGVVVAALGIYAAIVLKPEGNEPTR